MSGQASALDLIDVQLLSVQYGAQDIKLYELCRTDGGYLPAAMPGAHIDVHIPNGMVRQYSLLQAAARPRAYAIAVKRDRTSRGGSLYMHDYVKPGTELHISPPRNNFPLIEDAEETIFIAGGIGITPIWCMVNRLKELGRTWRLYYSCRSRGEAVFAEHLAMLGGVHFHFDDEHGGRFLDVQAIIEDAHPHVQLYCCGPSPMLASFREATRGRPGAQLHTESFSASQPKAVGRGYVVELSRSRREIEILPGQTILQALREAGFNPPYSCEEGICGTCETRVIAGIPDHRDSVLTATERARNTKMMICCSGSVGPRLVLDL